MRNGDPAMCEYFPSLEYVDVSFLAVRQEPFVVCEVDLAIPTAVVQAGYRGLAGLWLYSKKTSVSTGASTYLEEEHNF